MKKLFKKEFLKSESGSAAIEAVFVVPFICVLYAGAQDLTSLIAYNKQMTDISDAVSDSVAQYKDKVIRSDVTDIQNIINLIMLPAQVSSVQVDVYDYYLNGLAVTKRWSTASPGGSNCLAPDTSKYSTLMSPGNDVVVAVTCMTYTPWVATLFGNNLLGATSFNLSQSVAAVPYQSKVLNCYTTSSGNTPCNEI